MKFVKQLLSFVLALFCALGVVLSNTSMSQIIAINQPSDWAKEAVENGIKNGYITHYSLRWDYQNPITRLEFCILSIDFISYVLGQDIEEILEERGLEIDKETFQDTEDFRVLASYALKITNGTAPGLFSPDESITREQAAVMLARIADIIQMKEEVSSHVVYQDFEESSIWARQAIEFCLNRKIMNGTSASPLIFSPKKNYTKEQSMVTFYHLDKLFKMGKFNLTFVKDLDNTTLYYLHHFHSDIPSVQQFPYKKEGLAYGYIEDEKLYIKTPSKSLKIDLKYPIIGDILADNKGNFYIVWGRENDDDDPKFETTFISKYNDKGIHIKTTGFVGDSTPFDSDDFSKTKIPFHSNQVSSVINDGILVNYHGKLRIDGHQTDQVVAVRTEDMREYKMPNTTFSGHSFAQGVIYSKKLGDFLFASLGDGFIRGFRVNDRHGKYGDEEQNIFHFYLQPQAAYDMTIVNNTFSQFGGIVELDDDNVALVGASVKSIGEDAKTEKQNLFVQIFDPSYKKITPKMFKGGTIRKGMSSFNIYDRGNRPNMKEVTDYGVRWLTDYTDRDVLSPQVVKAKDYIVILWSTLQGPSPYSKKRETFYMILDLNGNIVRNATSLGKMLLNSGEKPVFHDGMLHWVSVQKNRLRIHKLPIDVSNDSLDKK